MWSLRLLILFSKLPVESARMYELKRTINASVLFAAEILREESVRKEGVNKNATHNKAGSETNFVKICIINDK